MLQSRCLLWGSNYGSRGEKNTVQQALTFSALAAEEFLCLESLRKLEATARRSMTGLSARCGSPKTEPCLKIVQSLQSL